MTRAAPVGATNFGRGQYGAVAGARALLGIVFIVAAVLKWQYPTHGVTLYGSLPSMGIHLPMVIITAEAILGLWLLSGLAGGTAGFTSVITLSLFTGAIILDMFQPHPLPCGCMGAAYVAAHSPAAVERGLAMGMARNLFLAILAATVWLCAPGGHERLTTRAEKLSDR
jgi:hypothetical protein